MGDDHLRLSYESEAVGLSEQKKRSVIPGKGRCCSLATAPMLALEPNVLLTAWIGPYCSWGKVAGKWSCQ